MIEPAASPRLQRVRDAYESSLRPPHDAALPAPVPLRADAVVPPADPSFAPFRALPLAPRAASTSPSSTSSASTSSTSASSSAEPSSPSDPPRSSVRPLADGYTAFRDRAFAPEPVSAAFLATIAAQASALALVWEAHARGAVTLPPAVAAAVGAARLAAR